MWRAALYLAGGVIVWSLVFASRTVIEASPGFWEVMCGALALWIILVESVYRWGPSEARTPRAPAEPALFSSSHHIEELRSLKRPAVRWTHLAFYTAFVAAAGFILVFTISLMVVRESIDGRVLTTMTVLAHVLTPFVVGLLLVHSVIYWGKNHAKHRKLKRLERVIGKAVPVIARLSRLEARTPR
jgi:hypothetical protein